MTPDAADWSGRYAEAQRRWREFLCIGGEFARHRPPGCRFRMNLVPDARCFKGEASARAWAAGVLRLPESSLVLVAGHYLPRDNATLAGVWEYRPGGWMVFQREGG